MANLIITPSVSSVVQVEFQRIFIPVNENVIYMILPNGDKTHMIAPVYATQCTCKEVDTKHNGDVEIIDGIITVSAYTLLRYGTKRTIECHMLIQLKHLHVTETKRLEYADILEEDTVTLRPQAKEEKGEKPMAIGPEEAAKYMSHDEQQEVKQLINNIDSFLRTKYNGEHIIQMMIPKKYHKLKLYARHKVIEEYRKAGWQDAIWEETDGKNEVHKFKLVSGQTIFKVNLPEGEFEKEEGREHPEEPVDHQEALKERERKSKW